MKTLVSKERGDFGHRVRSVVVHKLSQGKEVDPIILLVVDIYSKVLLQDLVDPFCLTMSLRVVPVERFSLMPRNWKSSHQN